jgi:hypothetical protein
MNRYLYANGDSANLADPTGRLTAAQYSALTAVALSAQGLIAWGLKRAGYQDAGNILASCALMAGIGGGAFNLKAAFTSPYGANAAMRGLAGSGYIIAAFTDAACLIGMFLTN